MVTESFDNYYMCHAENSVLQCATKPHIYARYVDDIFIEVDHQDQLIHLKNEFENKTVLKFTHENSINSKLPFLDVLIETKQTLFSRSVFTKSTNSGDCLNFDCAAPDRYKFGLIHTLLNRAYKICSSWENFHAEVIRIKKLLVNNNYPNRIID